MYLDESTSIPHAKFLKPPKKTAKVGLEQLRDVLSINPCILATAITEVCFKLRLMPHQKILLFVCLP